MYWTSPTQRTLAERVIVKAVRISAPGGNASMRASSAPGTYPIACCCRQSAARVRWYWSPSPSFIGTNRASASSYASARATTAASTASTPSARSSRHPAPTGSEGHGGRPRPTSATATQATSAAPTSSHVRVYRSASERRAERATISAAEKTYTTSRKAAAPRGRPSAAKPAAAPTTSTRPAISQSIAPPGPARTRSSAAARGTPPASRRRTA